MVPGSGIEPPTQGFSGLAHVVSIGRFWSVLVCFHPLISLQKGGNDQNRPHPARKTGKVRRLGALFLRSHDQVDGVRPGSR